MVNGANVVEGKNNGAAVIPNLDSIAEFRIITNNFDAEYGNYTAPRSRRHQVRNNAFHGNAFEFLRNTGIGCPQLFRSGRHYRRFQTKSIWRHSRWPIQRDKLFFFADFQATRQI